MRCNQRPLDRLSPTYAIWDNLNDIVDAKVRNENLRGVRAMLFFGGGMRDAPSGKQYVVCEGGYRQVEASTFQDAVGLAKRIRWFSPDGAFSIYEVQTGIHFEVPNNTIFDDLTLLTMPMLPLHAERPNL